MFGFGRAWASCLYVYAREDHPQHKATTDYQDFHRLLSTFCIGKDSYSDYDPASRKIFIFFIKARNFSIYPLCCV